jgi:hypothetical protein
VANVRLNTCLFVASLLVLSLADPIGRDAIGFVGDGADFFSVNDVLNVFGFVEVPTREATVLVVVDAGLAIDFCVVVVADVVLVFVVVAPILGADDVLVTVVVLVVTLDNGFLAVTVLVDVVLRTAGVGFVSSVDEAGFLAGALLGRAEAGFEVVVRLPGIADDDFDAVAGFGADVVVVFAVVVFEVAEVDDLVAVVEVTRFVGTGAVFGAAFVVFTSGFFASFTGVDFFLSATRAVAATAVTAAAAPAKATASTTGDESSTFNS